jgi:outer membrane protein insertion porin family
MVKGTVFVDFGTVERDIAIRAENFRVAPGFGFRINVPALGPAPLALDFSFPLHSAPGDTEQMFSFFFGLSRQ